MTHRIPPGQTLNRDVWKNPEINALVSEKFLFWQRQHDTPDAEKYIQYYKRDSYPHIAILDPATGQSTPSTPSTPSPISLL